MRQKFKKSTISKYILKHKCLLFSVIIVTYKWGVKSDKKKVLNYIIRKFPFDSKKKEKKILRRNGKAHRYYKIKSQIASVHAITTNLKPSNPSFCPSCFVLCRVTEMLKPSGTKTWNNKSTLDSLPLHCSPTNKYIQTYTSNTI